jgi:hypothetical protein
MKLFLVVGLGIVASFGLTVLAEFLWLNSGNGIWHVHPEFFCIPLIVGAGVGLALSRRAVVAAALSLAPWSVTMIVGANAGHSTMSRWAITIAVVSAYFALGIGAAALVGRVMARYVAKGGQSPSQEHG